MQYEGDVIDDDDLDGDDDEEDGWKKVFHLKKVEKLTVEMGCILSRYDDASYSNLSELAAEAKLFIRTETFCLLIPQRRPMI